VTVRVGVIGVGNIGQDHIRRLTRRVAGAEVVAVSDVDTDRAEAVARQTPGARVFPTGQGLIRADEVEAVLVASWGPTHEEFVLAAIEADKPVFCEKPLAPTSDECLRILDAEMARGRRLVQVGFNRRYDLAYRQMKATLVDGGLGTPLMAHCAHRNPSVPPHYVGGMPITDTAIHEIDIMRWLFHQEITAARVLKPPRTSRAKPDLQDPLIVLMEMSSGAIVDVEVFVTLAYGYDIRCEVVCELGTVALGDGSPVVVRKDNLRSDRVSSDFQERFAQSYENEVQEWVDSVARGEATGPSSWDGYAATAVADACLAALDSGERVSVEMRQRPAFYGPAGALTAVLASGGCAYAGRGG
jgi:myo-inositol 2-dehydrogenase / D-chiro-inositol 1-dehydrogenase